jgi:hypothetical protein
MLSVVVVVIQMVMYYVQCILSHSEDPLSRSADQEFCQCPFEVFSRRVARWIPVLMNAQ